MKTTNNLRICLISPSRWRYTKRLAEELSALDNTVYLLVDERKGSKYPNLKFKGYFVKEAWKQDAPLPFYLVRLPLEIVKFKPEVVHIQFEYLVFGKLRVSLAFPILLLLLRLLAKAENFKVVLTMHSVIPLDKVSSFQKSILRPYTKLMILLSDKIAIHTNLAKQVLRKTYGNVPDTKVIVIPHGVETSFPSIKAEKTKELDLEGRKIVLHFGIIRTSKGLDKLLEAFKKVLKSYHNVVLVVAGWFHEYLTEPEIRELLFSISKDEVLKGQVRVLIGYLPDEKLFEMVSASDVICLPYKENYVVGVSGAMADIVLLGKPIIVTKCLKFLEFKLFPNVITAEDDADSLAKAMIKALEQPPEAVVDPSLLKKYTWEAVAEKTLSCYQAVLGKEG